MNLKKNHYSRRALALLLTLVMCVGMIPTAFAAQQNSYHDPAEHWMQASGRTNELDANSVVTRETFKCGECGKATSFEVFRVPEYGKSKTIFAPDDAITRAEFTTLAVRFFDVYGDGDAEIMEQYKDFNDVSDGYWAAAYIKAAAKHGWINGYGDGSFRADDEINRAEVVTIVNRLLGREADEDYIADNLRKLNTFPDVSRKHWAYYAVMEAANAHTAILGDSESWSK